MDEQALREMLAQVKHGGLTRRRFVQALAAAGLGGPVAGHLLGAAGAAAAQPREAEFTPTRRGGGGTLRILMWDAPTLLHPHFGRGLRDFTVQRIFYEPLAAPAADGTPFTADDVIFNWEFAVDPTTAAGTRAAYEDITRIEKIDSHTVKLIFKKPQPFWASAFTGGGLLPRHLFERAKGAGAREAIGMLQIGRASCRERVCSTV